MKQKFDRLEALVAELGLKQGELEAWILFRNKQKNGNLLPTPLPIVYRSGDELYLSFGVDPNNEGEVFGWLLDKGLIMRRQYPLDDGEELTYDAARSCASLLFYDSYQLKMATKEQVLSAWDFEQKLKVKKTMEQLETSGVYCGLLQDARCWCADDLETSAYAVDLGTDEINLVSKDQPMTTFFLTTF